MLAIFAMLYNISLSLSYTQYSLYILFPHPYIVPPTTDNHWFVLYI